MNNISKVESVRPRATPIPWKVVCTGERREIVAGEDDSVLGEVFGDDSDPQCWPITANATLIVQSVNAHHALVEACKGARADLKDAIRELSRLGIDAKTAYGQRIDALTAALKKAGAL